MFRSILLLILALFVAACSSLESEEKLNQVVEDDSEINEIYFGQSWSQGPTFELSDRQASRLRQ